MNRPLLVRALMFVAFAAFLAPSARAQLDLPKRPPRDQRPAPGEGEGPARGEPRLDLPGEADPASAEESPPLNAAAMQVGLTISPAAEYILGQLRRVRTVDDRMISQAVQSLEGLGSDGLVAARRALAADHVPLLLTGARVMLSSGSAHDKELVLLRLWGRLPATAGGPLVDSLIKLDPVRGSPRLLIELLDHAQSGVRSAAYTHLEERLDASLLPLLSELVESKRSGARLLAVQIAERIQSPDVDSFFLSVLDDRSAKVAHRAALALAASNDERVEKALLNRAFGRQWILRENAYAVLALVEREDLALRAILTENHVEPLLGGLASSDPFIAGTCAAALAGVGFRSATPDAFDWLDREVPMRLVYAVAGREYHNDFSSLQRTAERRLTLISGAQFSDNGPAWLEWWYSAAPTFSAHRAYLDVDDENVGTLQIHFRRRGPGADAFSLYGPDAAWTATEGARAFSSEGESLYMTAAQVNDFRERLEAEGVLGPERLPGRRGVTGSASRSLQFEIGGRGKSFEFGPGVDEAWFDRLVDAARHLRDRNRWQSFYDPEKYPTSLAFWFEEAAWWDEDHSDHERNLRRKKNVLAHLRGRSAEDRGPGIQELARLSEIEGSPGVLEAADFSPLLELLGGERYGGGRARDLVALAVQAGRLAGTPSDGAGPELPAELARDLLQRVLDAFDNDAAEEVALVLEAAGRPFLREACSSPHFVLRAVAAGRLARSPEEQDVEILRRLVDDPVPEVEVATVRALGEEGVAALRDELLLRARLGLPHVRAAALEAVGRIGGESVLEALVVGLSDPNFDVQAAAANGLAELGDPSSARLLASLLSRGRSSPLYLAARRGLMGLGESAWPVLMRELHATSGEGKREAALLLSQQGVPQAASPLLSLLTENPADGRVAAELSVLTCVDLRTETDPIEAWWAWWDTVVHDDSTAWLIGALEREGFSTPPREALTGKGTREGESFLVAVLEREEAHLVERARRELSRLLDRRLDPPPSTAEARDGYFQDLRREIRESSD